MTVLGQIQVANASVRLVLDNRTVPTGRFMLAVPRESRHDQGEAGRMLKVGSLVDISRTQGEKRPKVCFGTA